MLVSRPRRSVLKRCRRSARDRLDGGLGHGLKRNGDVAVAPRPSEPPLSDIEAEALAGALADLDADLGELSFLCATAEERLAGLDVALSHACPPPPTRKLLGGAAAS